MGAYTRAPTESDRRRAILSVGYPPSMTRSDTLRMVLMAYHLRTLRVVVVVVVCALTTAASIDFARAAPAVPREHHVWGKFKPGAWTLTRTTTESLDEKGKISSTSTTETRTTLVSVDDKGVELRVEVVVEVAGKRFEAKPRIVRQTFSGAHNGQSESVKELGREEIELDGRKVLCDVRRVDIKQADLKRTIKLFYTSAHSPYVLRREIDSNGGNGTAFQSVTDVIALDIPHRVLNDIKSTAHAKTVLRNGKSVVTTMVVMTMDVPGGVISENSKEVDTGGRLIRRTTIELADYGLEPPGTSAKSRDKKDGKSLFSRLRARRDKKRDDKGGTRSGVTAPEPSDAASPDGPSIAPVSRRKPVDS